MSLSLYRRSGIFTPVDMILKALMLPHMYAAWKAQLDGERAPP